jgi:two-component system, NarL family, sensor histidine kinase UhpB
MAVDVLTYSGPNAGWMHRIARRILGVPLVAKLLGANVLIVASALVVHTLAFEGRRAEIVTVLIALAAALIGNLVLVWLALQPIRELEELAHRVSDGEFDARGTPSLFADKDLAKLRNTVNDLLDSLTRERKRIQDLGVEVVRAHDVERANVARELHDSVAQTLAAVRFQLVAASRDEDAPSMRNRVAAATGMISAAMEEIVSVSNSLHSRVAEDLGLDAALGTLARQVESRSGANIELHVSPRVSLIPSSVSAMLFRVVEETLREVEMHGGRKSATVNVDARDGLARLEVVCEGSELSRMGMWPELSSIRHRLQLAGGVMSIENRNGGIRVSAEIRAGRVAS